MHRLFMNRGVQTDANGIGKDSQGDPYLTDVRYTGSFALISEHISELAGNVLPMRAFSCIDALGVASTEDVDFDEPGLEAVGAFYAERDVKIAAGVQIGGAIIAGDEVIVEGPGVRLWPPAGRATCRGGSRRSLPAPRWLCRRVPRY